MAKSPAKTPQPEAKDAPIAAQVKVARAPAVTREKLEAMGLDPAPYGFVDEKKSDN